MSDERPEGGPPERIAAGESAELRTGEIRLERRLGAVLRSGVYLSSACLAAGLAISVALGDGRLSGILMNGGLMILMATPVTRVAASIVEYLVDGDRTFFVLTSIVLLELAAGIVAALVFHRRL
jgi:uncharacterized membrane protein